MHKTTREHGQSLSSNKADISAILDDFADIAVKLDDISEFGIGGFTEKVGKGLKKFFGDDGIKSVSGDSAKTDSLDSFVDTMADIAVKLNGIQDVDSTVLTGLLASLSGLTIPDFTTVGTQGAGAFVGGFTAGLQNGLIPAAAKVSAFAASMESAARAAYTVWLATGNYLSTGLGNGIAAMAAYVRRVSVNMATGALRAIRLTWDVHSPAREGDALGRFLPLGVAGGIDAMAHVVNQSSENMAAGALDSAKSVLGVLSTDLTAGMDATPKIRPVIDLSDVNQGMHSIDNMFNANRALSAEVFRGARFRASAANMQFNGGKIAGASDNADVVTAIDALTEQFHTLSDAVTNMQLVLDTGMVAGQMSTKMDKQLGMLAGRRERGSGHCILDNSLTNDMITYAFRLGGGYIMKKMAWLVLTLIVCLVVSPTYATVDAAMTLQSGEYLVGADVNAGLYIMKCTKAPWNSALKVWRIKDQEAARVIDKQATYYVREGNAVYLMIENGMVLKIDEGEVTLTIYEMDFEAEANNRGISVAQAKENCVMGLMAQGCNRDEAAEIVAFAEAINNGTIDIRPISTSGLQEKDATADTAIADGVSPTFREKIDSLEAFFDAYIEFMTTYAQSSNPMAMLEYTNLMTQYAEAMDNLDQIESEYLTPEEDAYYVDALLRINGKLALYSLKLHP